MGYLCCLFIIIIISFCASQGEKIDCSKTDCSQWIDPFSCPSKTVYYKNAALGNCCPGCLQFKGPDEPCTGDNPFKFDITNYFSKKSYITTGEAAPIVPVDYCAPGLKCANGICGKSYNCSSYGNPKWKPTCAIDDSFEAVQCKDNGEQPRCFCYSRSGQRIFGFDWIANKDNMRCLCSRLMYDLKKSEDATDMVFHCSQNGNFEPLQCVRGFCYCADIYTGQPRSAIVPQSLWNRLPCYKKATMGSQYLKKCDSQANAVALILKELKKHGGNAVTIQSPPCDPDGSYSAKQCESTNCFCENKDRKKLGSYFTDKDSVEAKKQLCYCARDKEMIFPEMRFEHPYTCDSGGNYVPLQTINGQAFCVDSDGFLTSDVVPEDRKCELTECVDQSAC